MATVLAYWRLGLAVVLMGASGWLGYRVGSSACSAERVDAANEVVRTADSALASANRTSEADTKRSAAVQQQRDRIQQEVRGLNSAFATLPRTDCDRFTDAERLLLERERQAYRGVETDSAGHVLSPVSGDARD